jgi:methylmalonyl-CoA mutase N-terminal domain/subunit
MEQGVWELIKEIDNMGGMIKAIENGWVQSETERTIAAYMDKVAKGEKVVVGYNKYQINEQPDYGTFSVDPKYEKKQKKRLKKLKQKRDHHKVEQALKHLGEAVSGADNLMTPCMQAARLRATFGEMTQAIYGKMQSYSTPFYNMKSKMFA